ncbi:hypothetical protein D3C71_1498180 [compost metagenome]
MPGAPQMRRKIVEVAGVGQLIQCDDRFIALRQPVQNEVGSDETGAAGDKNAHMCKTLRTRGRADRLKARYRRAWRRPKTCLCVQHAGLYNAPARTSDPTAGSDTA